MKSVILKFLSIILVSALVVSCKKDEVNNPPSANAGEDQTITLPRDTVTLLGSGSDADGTITAYLWSQVSGPSTATIMNNGSASAFFDDLQQGTYVFRLAVYDNGGAVGTDEVSIVVNAPEIITLQLAPANNPNEIHFLGNDNGFNQSDISAPEFGAVTWTQNGTLMNMRGAFQFDLSNIPANAVITSAKLTLYSNPTPINGNQIDANYGSNNAMYIQRITSAWAASTVTWSTQPATTTQGQISIPSAPQGTLDLVDVDVTAMVNTMVSSGANYGFLIKLQNEVLYNSRIFCSSKYSDATKHPKLVVEYAQP